MFVRNNKGVAGPLCCVFLKVCMMAAAARCKSEQVSTSTALYGQQQVFKHKQETDELFKNCYFLLVSMSNVLVAFVIVSPLPARFRTLKSSVGPTCIVLACTSTMKFHLYPHLV